MGVEAKPHIEEPEKPKTTPKPVEKSDMSTLTPAEVKKVDKNETTLEKIAQERRNLQITAETEMKEMLDLKKTGDVVDFGSYKELKTGLEDLKQEMDATQSAEKTKKILEQMRQLPQEIEQQQVTQNEELDENDPRRAEKAQQFASILRENKHLIGEDESVYTKWFQEEFEKDPTLAHANDLINRFEGKKVYDKDGLAPRREVYKKLEETFKKHGLSSPQKSEFIKNNGLKERQEFLSSIEKANSEVSKANDQFWSNKAKTGCMQEILQAKNPLQQKELTLNIKKINQIESEGFIYMKNTLSVGGVTVRKMSDSSIDAFLLGLKNEGKIEDRMKYITGNGKYSNGIKEAVENEASLYGVEVRPEVTKLFGITKGLLEIYKDNPDGYKLALKSFERLDFMKKIESLKEHKRIVEKATSKEDLEKKLSVKSAHTSIDEAARKKIVSKTTQEKYKAWFSDEDNYKNPETGEPGDLDTLKKYIEILNNPTPDGKTRNLAAYEVKRKRFGNEMKDMTDEEQQKWQEKYDKEGWTGRKAVYKEMVKEKEHQEKEKKKINAIKNETGEKKESSESKSKQEVIKTSMNLINEDQPAEALKILMEFNEKNPDDKDIIFWMEVALKRMKEFGSGKKMETNTDKQLDQEIASVVESDQGIKDRMEEANITTLNIEGARMSELKHGNKIEGKDRAQKESLQRAQGNDLLRDLTKDYYEKTDKDHVINEDGEAEKVTEIQFNDVDMTDEKRQQLKDTTRQKEGRLIQKEGFTHIRAKDKSGKTLSAEQADKENQKVVDKLEEDLSQKAADKVEKKTGTVFDLTERIAARRKSRDILDKERHSHENLKKAA